MSSMETTSSSTSEEGSCMAFPHQRIPRTSSNNKEQSYNKLYKPNHRSVSRSRSIAPRAKSIGPFAQPHSIYPSRTQSYTSLYDTEYGSARGTSLDLRPLQNSVSSKGMFFNDTGHVLKNPSYEQYGPISLSLQDICMLGEGGHKQRKTGRSLLDLSNVTINDSEIDKVRNIIYGTD